MSTQCEPVLSVLELTSLISRLRVLIELEIESIKYSSFDILFRFKLLLLLVLPLLLLNEYEMMELVEFKLLKFEFKLLLSLFVRSSKFDSRIVEFLFISSRSSLDLPVLLADAGAGAAAGADDDSVLLVANIDEKKVSKNTCGTKSSSFMISIISCSILSQVLVCLGALGAMNSRKPNKTKQPKVNKFHKTAYS